MMVIGERIRELRLNADMTLEDLAKRIDTTPQSIYKYEVGVVTNIPLEKIEALAEVFHVRPEYIAGWLPTKDYSAFPSPSSFSIPVLGVIYNQKEIFSRENIADFLHVDKHTIADACVVSNDDSMRDAGIFKGDKVLVKKVHTFEEGKIYAVLERNSSAIELKKVYRKGSFLILSPCNTACNLRIVHSDDIIIIGLATTIWHKL